jgi:hypothetical protein
MVEKKNTDQEEEEEKKRRTRGRRSTTLIKSNNPHPEGKELSILFFFAMAISKKGMLLICLESNNGKFCWILEYGWNKTF